MTGGRGTVRERGDAGLPVRLAVRYGALAGLLQMVVAFAMFRLGDLGVGIGAVTVLLWAQAAVGMGAAYHRASRPRFAVASAPRRGARWAGAVLTALGGGTGLFVLWLVVVAVALEVPWPVQWAALYVATVPVLATTVYRCGRAPRRPVPAPAGPRRAEPPVPVLPTTGRPVRTVERAAAGDPERRARAAERAITEFGALLSAHPFQPGAVGVTYPELADHSLALDAYERAKSAPVAEVPGILAEGRAALGRLDARLGLDTAGSGAGCFFDQRHGPAVQSVRWAPPGGAVRTVEVCRADAVRLADGELPGGR
ncbi:hypothetical protein [Streptomyces sp. NPDC006997]|uniref:hypothetical protein n=1 Tax=Streptomyces sp. NPDC006997 TaxID=3155356 RepID=UPI0033E9C28D